MSGVVSGSGGTGTTFSGGTTGGGYLESISEGGIAIDVSGVLAGIATSTETVTYPAVTAADTPTLVLF